MASPAQIAANHQNAALSTGPKTAEGKRKSSSNATRHGLTGTQIVMPNEDAGAYEDLRQGLAQTFKPATEGERILTDQIAANAWRLLRAQRVETAFLAKLTEGSEDPDAAIALAFLEHSKELARVHRYVAAAQNAYYKAMRELSKLQKERAAASEPEQQEEGDDQLVITSLEPQTSNQIGFVSYHQEAPVSNQPNRHTKPVTTHSLNTSAMALGA